MGRGNVLTHEFPKLLPKESFFFFTHISAFPSYRDVCTLIDLKRGRRKSQIDTGLNVSFNYSYQVVDD